MGKVGHRARPLKTVPALGQRPAEFQCDPAKHRIMSWVKINLSVPRRGLEGEGTDCSNLTT